MLKQILVPVAAFAVTVVGASAFTGNDWVSKLDSGLTDAQTSALEEAREIREDAREKALTVLEKAGIDDTKMREVHAGMRGLMQAHHEAVESAIESGNYTAFLEAVKDTPMAEVINTEAEFKKLQEAHELRESGDFDEAREIMEELGMPGRGGMMGEGRMGGGMRGGMSGRGR
jgi:hypothetical protein